MEEHVILIVLLLTNSWIVNLCILLKMDCKLFRVHSAEKIIISGNLCYLIGCIAFSIPVYTNFGMYVHLIFGFVIQIHIYLF